MISPFAHLINLVLGKLSCLWIWLGPDDSLASYLWEVSLPQLGQQRCWLTASWSGGQGEGQRAGISERLPHWAKQNCSKTAASAILKTGKQLLFQALIHLYLDTCGWSITHAVLTCRVVDFSSSGALRAGEGRPLLPLTSSLVLWWGMQLEAAETSAEFLLDVCLSPAWVFIVFLYCFCTGVGKGPGDNWAESCGAESFSRGLISRVCQPQLLRHYRQIHLMGLGHQKTVILSTDRWEDGHFHFLKVFGGCLRKSSFSDLPSELWDFPSTDALSGIQSPSQVPWPVWGPWLLSAMRCVSLFPPAVDQRLLPTSPLHLQN